MPIPIRFLDTPPLREDGTVDFSHLVVGDLCFYHHQGKPCLDRAQLDKLHLTAHYFANNSSRPPFILALPNHAGPKLYFVVDGQCYSRACTGCGQKYEWRCTCGNYRERGYYDGWTVSGAPPQITVNPSVNYDEENPAVKHYHGFIQNGVIGDG